MNRGQISRCELGRMAPSKITVLRGEFEVFRLAWLTLYSYFFLNNSMFTSSDCSTG